MVSSFFFNGWTWFHHNTGFIAQNLNSRSFLCFFFSQSFCQLRSLPGTASCSKWRRQWRRAGEVKTHQHSAEVKTLKQLLPKLLGCNLRHCGFAWAWDSLTLDQTFVFKCNSFAVTSEKSRNNDIGLRWRGLCVLRVEGKSTTFGKPLLWSWSWQQVDQVYLNQST